MKNKFSSKLKLTLAVALSVLLINGCKDSAVQQNTENMDFSVTSNTQTAARGMLLEIDLVKVLVKDIKLNVAASNENMVNFKTGPYVLYLDFTSNVTVVSTGYVPAGSYDRVKFEIHKLGDNESPPDPEFVDAQGRYSVIVKGRVNGVMFTFKSSMSSHQIVSFPSSLVVTADGKSNITLEAKPYMWFIQDGVFLDPLNEINRTAIELNIKNNINNNIRVFVDNDKNGQPD
ncbi:MAG TPA: hypothetical protein VJ455_11915 [Ignavibacteria bacterium]|nr:hypothetical protein [Ignavibacteria bacterium]